MKFRATLLALLAAACWSLPLAAMTLEAEGVAALDAGGPDKARQQAVQDALRQAALSAGAQVQASSSSNSATQGSESLRVTPTASVTKHTVVREWTHDGLLHVLVRAEIQETPSACGVTGSPHAYRKKITATRFYVMNSLQVEDITDIWTGYPLELLRRLGASGDLFPINSAHALQIGARDLSPDTAANRDIIRAIAVQTGSQFVLSGIILDAGWQGERISPYAGWQGDHGGRRFEIALPFNQLAAGIRPVPTERRFDVEIFLHDGLTGALVARHRENVLVNGKVMVGRDKLFASAAFFATDYGQALDRIMNAQTAAIRGDVACLPFTANVLRVEGRKVFIDAGTTSRLAPGDKLTLYRTKPEQPAITLNTQALLGVPEAPATTLTLTQVQPLIAIGELAADPVKLNIQAGDIVRFDAPGR